MFQQTVQQVNGVQNYRINSNLLHMHDLMNAHTHTTCIHAGGEIVTTLLWAIPMTAVPWVVLFVVTSYLLASKGDILQLQCSCIL